MPIFYMSPPSSLGSTPPPTGPNLRRTALTPRSSSTNCSNNHDPLAFARSVPSRGSLVAGVTQTPAGLAPNTLGHVKCYFQLPVCVFVRPLPGTSATFEPLEYEDLVEAEQGMWCGGGMGGVVPQAAVPGVGAMSYGWWFDGGVFKGGFGKVVRVLYDRYLVWVDRVEVVGDDSECESEEGTRGTVGKMKIKKTGKDVGMKDADLNGDVDMEAGDSQEEYEREIEQLWGKLDDLSI
ncbi:hypothetical protein BJY01DRAFT_256414 [Aspergillus pseudoustus]|uniref:Uncharacterized protein n=1 Tax=Aspergillus pseudoustus TaxID=1810923 RepID=A0ABR4IAF5_9EURO